MNIFFLDPNPKTCAAYHCDKHVIKMILETTQMLSTAYHLCCPDRIKDLETSLYKPAYKNHPSTIWARESIQNFRWLHSLGMALCKEYTYRYYKTHKSETILRSMCKALPILSNKKFEEPPQCMPEIWKSSCAVSSYRTYYFMEKSSFAKWERGRNAPFWWKESLLK